MSRIALLTYMAILPSSGTATCPCFSESDLTRFTTEIASGGLYAYDIASSNCVEIEISSNESMKQLFAKDDSAIKGKPYHALGYGAIKSSNGFSSCMAADTFYEINENEAQACLDLVTDACQKLDEATCPCFNLYSLHQAAESSDQITCAREGIGADIKAKAMYDGNEIVFGVGLDEQTCIGQRNDPVGINKNQFGHCQMLLDKTCNEKGLPITTIEYTCPCFDETHLKRLTTKVTSGKLHTYDLASSNCIEIEISSSKYKKQLFVKNDSAINGNPYHALGYGAMKSSNGESTCIAADMRFKANENEAQACLDLISDTCQKLDEATCPCFNLYSLHQAAESNDQITCAREGSGADIKAKAMYDGNEIVFGVGMDEQTCIGQGNDPVGINKNQFGHCQILLDRTCEEKDLPNTPGNIVDIGTGGAQTTSLISSKGEKYGKLFITYISVVTLSVYLFF